MSILYDECCQTSVGRPELQCYSCGGAGHLATIGQLPFEWEPRRVGFRPETGTGLETLLMAKKEEALEVEGTVTQALANTRFRVQVDDGPLVLAHVAGKMRKHFIRIVPGDRVKVELSPYDLTKGRIVYRER